MPAARRGGEGVRGGRWWCDGIWRGLGGFEGEDACCRGVKGAREREEIFWRFFRAFGGCFRLVRHRLAVLRACRAIAAEVRLNRNVNGGAEQTFDVASGPFDVC